MTNTFQRANQNAQALDSLVGGPNADVPVPAGGTKPSWQKITDDINAAAEAQREQIDQSRGFRVRGTFAAGFTYELPNDVGTDAIGNPWILVDSSEGNLPFTVPAGTTPSLPVYQQVAFGDIDNVTGLRGELDDRALNLTLSEAQAKTDLSAGQVVFISDLGSSRFIVESSPLTHTSFTHTAQNSLHLNYRPTSEVKISASGATSATNSAQALRDTFAYASELGLFVDGDNKEYLTQELVSNEIPIKLRNAVLVSDIADVGFDFGAKTASATTTLASNPLLGQKVLTVADSSGMSAGDLIVLTSDRVWPYDIDRGDNAGEVQVIESINGNELTLEANLKDGYTTLENVSVQAYTPVDFEIENVEFKRRTREDKISVNIRRCVRPKIRNVTARDSSLTGINMSLCYQYDIQCLYLYDNYVPTTPTGYGLQDNGCMGGQIRGLVAKGNRRAIDFSGGIPSKFGSVDGFYVIGLDNTGSCMGTHGTAVGSEFRNGICDGGLVGLQIRSPLSVLENVTFINTETRCITLNYTMSLKVVNCKSEPSINGATTGSIAATVSRFIEVGNLPDDLPNSEWLEINNCTGTVRTLPIRIGPSANDGLKYIRAKGNSFRIRTNSNANQLNFIESTAAANLSESVIVDNSITLNTLGQQNTLLGDNITVADSARLIIQPILIDDTSLIEAWSGDGSLSNQELDIRMSSDGEFCRVQGTVKFTVSGATTGARIRIAGVLQKSDESKVGNIATSESGSAIQENLVTKYNRQFLYIAADGWRTSGSDTEPFSNGDYYINVDIKYPLRFPFQFGLLN